MGLDFYSIDMGIVINRLYSFVVASNSTDVCYYLVDVTNAPTTVVKNCKGSGWASFGTEATINVGNAVGGSKMLGYYDDFEVYNYTMNDAEATEWVLNNNSVGAEGTSPITNTIQADFGANPIDNFDDNNNVQVFDFKCSGSGTADYIQLWSNLSGSWTADYTNTSYLNNTWLNITVSGITRQNNYKWAVYCNDTTSIEDWTTNRTYNYPPAQVNVSLVSPANKSIVTTTSQTFVCNASSSDGLSNMTFYLWNSTGDLIYSSKNYFPSYPSGTSYSGTWTNPTQMYDKDWTTFGNLDAGTTGYYYVNFTNYTSYNSSNPPILQIKINGDAITNKTLFNSNCRKQAIRQFRFSGNSHAGTTITTDCWTGSSWITSFVSFVGIDGLYKVYETQMFWGNNPNFSYSLPYEGNYTWNCYAEDINGVSNWSSNNFTANFIPNITYSQSGLPASLVAGDDAVMTLNITMPSGLTEANATLLFNGTYYSATGINDGTYYVFTKSIPISMDNNAETIYWHWNFTLENSYALNRTTTTENITIYNVSLSDCAVTDGRIILEMNLTDEETGVELNTSSNIEVDLNITNWLNSSYSLNFHKQWINQSNISICISNDALNFTSFRIDVVAEYGADNYANEFWYLDNGTLNTSNYFNSHTLNSIKLYDLLLADSTTFLFTYTDENGLEIDDALIHTFRKYIGEGIFREVERSKQDTNGETHIHLVEEDVIYYFMVTQNGRIEYISGNYNAKCLSSPCSITLTKASAGANWSIVDNQGGRYLVTSDKDTRLVTLTWNIDSSDLVNMSLYKMDNNELSIINETSKTSASSSMSLSVPYSYGNATFFVAIYRDNSFIKSSWVDFRDKGKDYFGTFGVILASLIVLALMLMSISEGAGFIVFTVLGLIVVSLMALADLNWMAIVSIICAGGIIIWKLMGRRKT
jgi:hypothetical protein